MAVKHYLSFIEGAYTDVAPMLIPDNGLYTMSNVNTSYKLGSILKRPGYVIVGSALEANNSITGLYNFRQNETTSKVLATVNNANDNAMQLLYSTGSSWTELTDAETAWSGYEDANVEMEAFIEYCFFVGYDSTDAVWLPVRTLTGTTFGTTNTTNMPNAKYIKRYRDRLYLGNCYSGSAAYPYRVYFSSVPSAGTISWTVATDFIDVDYSEAITGLGENWDEMLIFTEYSTYMYNQESFKKVFDVGCSNHRTIKNSGAYTIWANRDGVWASTGGRPNNIAGRIIDFIRASNMKNSFAEIVGEEYYLYLGSVTVNGVAYSNCTAVFNIPTQTWRIHEYYNTMTVFGKYFSSGKDALWMGTSVGSVMRHGQYSDSTFLPTDNGQPIHSWFQTGALHFDYPHIKKVLNKIVTYTDRAMGLKLKARVWDANAQAITEFRPLGEIKKYIDEFQINPNKGHLLQIEGIENGSNAYWSFFGFTVDYTEDAPFKK